MQSTSYLYLSVSLKYVYDQMLGINVHKILKLSSFVSTVLKFLILAT